MDFNIFSTDNMIYTAFASVSAPSAWPFVTFYLTRGYWFVFGSSCALITLF